MLEALAAIARALLYAGVLSCAGTVFAARLLQTPELTGIATQYVRRGALLAIAASIASAIILIFRLGGQLDEATLSAVFISSFGAATAMLLAGAGMLLASLDDPTAKTMRLTHAALMTLSFALSGHAPAADLADGLIVFIHASAAAWWIGSLCLLRHACEQADFTVTAHAARRFSTWATRMVGALVIAGLVLIRSLLDFEAMPRLSAYEQLLLLKIGIVAVVLSLAAYNKLRLTPRLTAGDATAVSALRATINVELALIGAVLIATAVLTTYTSPPE